MRTPSTIAGNRPLPAPFPLILLAVAILSASARADNVITYNFNSDNGSQEGWYPTATGTVPPWGWNLQSSNKGGGWQAFRGDNSANSGAYLNSPCMQLENNKPWVNVIVTHRYDFPLSGTTANQAGQMQFRVDSGGGWGAWQGIPSAVFVNPNGGAVPDNYIPNYGPPLFSPLISTSGTLSVQAWAGTTPGFPTGDHEASEYTLFYSDFGLQAGNEVEFRFLMATNGPTSGTDTLVWEVNKVQIDGVIPCVPVPEPGTAILACIGGSGCLLLRRRQRWFACRGQDGGSAAA